MTTPHPGTREYRDDTVRIASLTVLEDYIENVTFMNCEIIGPAVLAPLENVTISGCSFDTRSESELFWVIPPSRQYVIGAVGLRGVSFYSCRFRRIGLAIPELQLGDFQRGFGFKAD